MLHTDSAKDKREPKVLTATPRSSLPEQVTQVLTHALTDLLP
jgi:hypothetical protein